MRFIFGYLGIIFIINLLLSYKLRLVGYTSVTTRVYHYARPDCQFPQKVNNKKKKKKNYFKK